MALNWELLLSTFGLLFVAELGDKTQLAVLAQVCKYRRPWAVFLGASLALTAVTAVGAAGGQLIGRLIPPAVLQWSAALAFIVMGVLIGREALRGASDDAGDCPSGEASSAACRPAYGWRVFGATFGLLFAAEMGDKTQLAVLSLAGQSAQPILVFAGGALALAAVTAIGVVGGEGLCRIVPKRTLLWVSAAAFVGMGALMAAGVL